MHRYQFEDDVEFNDPDAPLPPRYDHQGAMTIDSVVDETGIYQPYIPERELYQKSPHLPSFGFMNGVRMGLRTVSHPKKSLDHLLDNLDREEFSRKCDALGQLTAYFSAGYALYRFLS